MKSSHLITALACLAEPEMMLGIPLTAPHPSTDRELSEVTSMVQCSAHPSPGPPTHGDTPDSTVVIL